MKWRRKTTPPVDVEQQIALRKVEMRVAAVREEHAAKEARREAWSAERAARIQADRAAHTTLYVCPVSGCSVHMTSYLGRDEYRNPTQCTLHRRLLIDTGIRADRLPCGGAR